MPALVETPVLSLGLVLPNPWAFWPHVGGSILLFRPIFIWVVAVRVALLVRLVAAVWMPARSPPAGTMPTALSSAGVNFEFRQASTIDSSPSAAAYAAKRRARVAAFRQLSTLRNAFAMLRECTRQHGTGRRATVRLRKQTCNRERSCCRARPRCVENRTKHCSNWV